MTTTDMPPHDTPPAPSPVRLLRRSRDSRVATGVCGGLGEYFGVDPVLFRVLFAVSAFFGGAGILAYLVAWAALPETGTQRAPIDGLIGELKRRQIPPWAVVIGLGVLVWLAAFSWWTPGPVIPVLIALVVLTVVLGRRELQGGAQSRPDGPTVDLTKPAITTPSTDSALPWLDEARDWWNSAKEAGHARRRRALPVRIATLLTLVVALLVLAAFDVALPVLFWTIAGVVIAGLLVGLVLRRTPWNLLGLTPLVLAGLVAFSGTHVSLHDGFGTRTWTPTSSPASHYRLAFGRGVLDLRSLPQQSQARTVRVDAASGQVRVMLPEDANVRVVANVHIGAIDVPGSGTTDGGLSLRRVIPAPAGAPGARTTVDVHLADGQVQVIRG